MRFVRAVWKLLVGIKDALVLLLMLLFFGVLWAGLNAGPKPIGDGVLLVELDGSLVEQPQRQSASSLVGAGSVAREHRLRDVVAAVDAAASDDRVKAIALDLEKFVGGGQTAIASLGEAMDRARKTKPVLAYATGYSDDGYQLAAQSILNGTDTTNLNGAQFCVGFFWKRLGEISPDNTSSILNYPVAHQK